MNEMKNPCLSCDHHLSGYEKNGPKCKACNDRFEYCRNLGGLSEAVPMDVNLDCGSGGTKLPKKQMPDINPVVLNEINKICESHNMSFEYLANNKRNNRAAESACVNDIIIMLASEFHMSNQMIAKTINTTATAVYLRLQKMGRLDAEKFKPEPTITNVDVENIRLHQPDKGLVVAVDFMGHEYVYDELTKLAETELRTVQNQVIYILRKYTCGT